MFNGISFSMKTSNRTALLFAALLIPSIAQAGDASLVDTFTEFTDCDAGFFASLHGHSDIWKAHVPLGHGENTSWIAVENRTSKSANSVLIRNTPEVAGLELLSYFDEVSDLGSLGVYLYWGFIVEGRTAEVAKRLTPLMKNSELLQQVESSYVRSEVKEDGRWQTIKPTPGAPGTTRLERVLILEPEGPEDALTRISCSLQGAVDNSSLAELRPDIPATDYPQKLTDTQIDNVALPEGLLKSLNSPLLQPKFISLKYIYESKKNGGSRGNPVSVTLHAEDGLLKKTENYRTFQVERITKADLVQLKSKMSGIGNERVFLTRELEINAPKSWDTGQKFTARIRMEYFPAKRGDKSSERLIACTVGKSFPARQVFDSLPGNAFELICNQGNSRTLEAFIEDLGVAITLEYTAASENYVYEISSLELER